MTAEIAVMNTLAVALAADSAVTIGRDGNQKIYNTGNKLFALSKYHPVGVMFFGNAEFMGVPWETIVKVHRAKLGTKKNDSLTEYAKDFISFLENETATLCTPKIQEEYFRIALAGYFQLMVNEIDDRVKSIIQQEGGIASQQVTDIVSDVIGKHYTDWTECDTLPSVPATYAQEILKTYGDLIEQEKLNIFQQLPISDDLSNKLAQICANLFCKDRFPDDCSGIVIAGFGNEEIFPSVISYVLEAVVCGKLKYRQINYTQAGRDNNASIIPFAQREMVNTFVEGTDPSHRDAVTGFLRELTLRYPEYILESLSDLPNDKKTELAQKLQNVAESIVDDFSKQISEYEGKHHVSSILEAVAALPKDELAAMAESRVKLKTFKRRVSLQAETVGGPIDVAVISKGDGSIWIKRKHYFEAELNPAFFSNYFRETRMAQRGDENANANTDPKHDTHL